MHKVLGHACDKHMRDTMKMIQDSDKDVNCDFKCTDCDLSKSMQRAVNKMTVYKNIIPGEKISIDISYVMCQSFGGSKYWDLVVDQATGFKWSLFLKSKDLLGKGVCELICNNGQLKKILNIYG